MSCKEKYGQAALRVQYEWKCLLRVLISCDVIPNVESFSHQRLTAEARTGFTGLRQSYGAGAIQRRGDGAGSWLGRWHRRTALGSSRWPHGKAYGLDMTDEMLALARENQRRAGFENVEFLKGEIENIPLPDNSVDIIIRMHYQPVGGQGAGVSRKPSGY